MIAVPPVPVEQVMGWEPPAIFKRLSDIARRGTYDAFDPIIKGLKAQGPEAVSGVLDRLGDDGPSLLHWAAKRGTFVVCHLLSILDTSTLILTLSFSFSRRSSLLDIAM